jgi:hypothetical protein
VARSWCERVLALILMIMTVGSLKIVLNWEVPTNAITTVLSSTR